MLITVLEYLFWVSVAMILIPMVFYPAVMLVIGLLSTKRKIGKFTEYPFVSIMVAARNEEKVIASRIENLLSQDYPADRFEVLVASDVSTDSTDSIVLGFSDPRIRFLRSEERLGKSALMVKLSGIARGEILVFTDANTEFRENTVRELVEPFADDSVGCVDGSKQNSLNNVTCESIYWRYEQMLKALGSRIGSVLGATGAVFAVRKSLYDPPDPSRADDFETAVSARIKGYQCVYNPEAVAAEPTPDNSSQYHRLVRIVSWMMGSAFNLLGKAFKAGKSGLFVQLAVHKILRWNMGFFAVTASLAGLALGIFDSTSNPLFASVVIFNIMALAGKILKGRMPSALRLPFFFWLMCIASMKGVYKALTSRSAAIWDHSAR